MPKVKIRDSRVLTLRSHIAPNLGVFVDVFNAYADSVISSDVIKQGNESHRYGWTPIQWLAVKPPGADRILASLPSGIEIIHDGSIQKEEADRFHFSVAGFLSKLARESAPNFFDCKKKFFSGDFLLGPQHKTVSEKIGEAVLKDLLKPFHGKSPRAISKLFYKAHDNGWIFNANPSSMIEEALTTLRQVCAWATMHAKTPDEAIVQLRSLLEPTIIDPRTNRATTPLEFLAFAPNASIGIAINTDFPTHMRINNQPRVPIIKQVSDPAQNPFDEKFIQYWAERSPKVMGCPMRHKDQIERFKKTAEIYIKTTILFIKNSGLPKPALDARID